MLQKIKSAIFCQRRKKSPAEKAQLPKLLIIGGSFATSFSIGNYINDFDVTIIDRKEFHEYTPAIHYAIVEPQLHPKLTKSFQAIYGDVATFIHVEVLSLDKNTLLARNVKTNQKFTLNFDYCIICSGSLYADSIKSSPSKDDLMNNRWESIQTLNNKVREAENILVIGGGIVGVEIAGEIAEKEKKKNITIMTNSKSLLPTLPPKAQELVMRIFEQKKIKMIFGQRSTPDFEKNFDLVLHCTGNTYSPEFMKAHFSNFLDESLNIRVNDYLQILNDKGESISNIFCYGDAARTTAGTEKVILPVYRQGKVVSHNLGVLEKLRKQGTLDNKTTFRKFVNGEALTMVSVGGRNAIFIKKRIIIRGIMIWLFKKLLCKASLGLYEKKLWAIIFWKISHFSTELIS